MIYRFLKSLFGRVMRKEGTQAEVITIGDLLTGGNLRLERLEREAIEAEKTLALSKKIFAKYIDGGKVELTLEHDAFVILKE